MNTFDEKWQRLLLRSAPAFAGESEPPYGFVTGTLARLRVERGQQKELEQVGWRALMASLATLMAVITLTVGLQLQHRNDFDPGIKSLVELDNVSIP